MEACGVRGDQEGAEVWEARRFEHTKLLRQKERELETLNASAEDEARLTAEDEAAIRRLGASLDELLTLAAAIPGKQREILAEFYRCIYVWQLGTGFFELVVEFPSGVRVETVIQCGKLAKCSQPAMALACAALGPWLNRAGRRIDPQGATKTASELAQLWNRLCRRVDEQARWTARRIWGAALLHHYRNGLPKTVRDAVDRWGSSNSKSGGDKRGGVAMSLQEITARTGEPLETVLTAALSGKLGNAFSSESADTSNERDQITLGGVVLVEHVRAVVTLRGLHTAFPDHARREVIAATGWTADDAVRIHEMVRQLKVPRCWAVEWAQRHGVLVSDLAGRLYTRRSSWPLQATRSLEAALAAGPPEATRLDPAYWVNSSRTNNALPGISYRRLVRHATFALRVEAGKAGERSVYYWVGPEARQRMRTQTLAEAVAALGRPEVTANDFVLEKHLAKHVRAVFRTQWSNRTIGRMLQGRDDIIRLVAAPRTPWQGLRAYILVPRALRETTDPEHLRQWLVGPPR